MKKKETESDPVWDQLEAGDIFRMCVYEESALQKLEPKVEYKYLKILEKARLARIRIEDGSNDQRLQTIVERAIPIRTKVIEANFYRVLRLVKRFRDRGVDFVDLMQEGNVGLIEGVDRWRRYPGMTWDQHSNAFIINKMRALVNSQGQPYSLPSKSNYDFLNAVRRAKKDLSNERQVAPSAAEISERIKEDYGGNDNMTIGQIKVTRQSVFELMGYDQKAVSLDANYFDKSSLEYEILGANINNDAISPNDLNASWERVNNWMEQAGLSDGLRGEKRVIGLLYGSEGDERNLTYEDVGEILGIRKPSVFQKVKPAFKKLEVNVPIWAQPYIANDV